MVTNRLIMLVESRIRGNVYVRFGGEYLETCRSNAIRRRVLSLLKEVQKVYNQGKDYYDALKAVNNLVKDARKVQQTILMVGDISDIYVHNFQKMMADPNFTVEELAAIATGYSKLLGESSTLITELKTLTTSANGLSMSDAERMSLIDKIYNDVRDYKNLTQYYTDKTIGVSYLRAKKKNDTDRILNMYGKPDERYW